MLQALQGTFVECASPASVTLWLASVVLELVAAREVHAHSQPFVRRAALIASSQACLNPSCRLWAHAGTLYVHHHMAELHWPVMTAFSL